MLKQKQGEVGLGVILVVAVGLILALVMFQQVASNVEQGTQAVTGLTTATNYSVTGEKDVKVALAGQELGTVTAVVNATTGATIAAANYTVAECVRPTDGLKGICYTALTDVESGTGTGEGGVKVTYTYYPDGYIDDSGARSVTGLIVLLTAIGIVMIAYLGIRRFD